LLAGCATNKAYREGKELVLDGKYEQGITKLEQAVKEAPGNPEYKTYLAKQRERIVNQLLAQAEAARLNGRFDEAEALYQRALKIDPRNPQITARQDALATDRRHKTQLDEAQALIQKGSLDEAQSLLHNVLAENPRNREAKIMMRTINDKRPRGPSANPQLRLALARPITLEFRDASLRAIFEVISRTAAINFVFDKDVRPDLKATIFVRNTTIEDAVQLLLVTNQLDRRILNENTILVYPNTPVKQKDYQELTVKSFYLANAEAKETANLIRTMLKTRDVFVDDKRNMVVIRDTPEAIKLAEKMIAAQDLAEPEAVLEVEVLEVNRSRLQNLGIDFPEQISIASPGTSTTTTGTTTTTSTSFPSPIRTNATLYAFMPNPAFIVKLHALDTNANVLANPRIRVKNREKAKILIGDKVPVFTSTAIVNAGIAQSVSYLDVGVKLEVEPNIGLDDDVTIKVDLEVSSIVKEVDFKDSVAFQIGTRSAGTILRLRDGETQVLAGLIQDEDRSSISKVPGLGDLPVLGRLFSSHTDNTSKSEVVLLITPRIVRNLALPDLSISEFRAGTETSLGGLGMRQSFVAPPAAGGVPPVAGPAAGGPAGAPPAAPPVMVPVPGIVPQQKPATMTPSAPPATAAPSGG
jgi:general secretion pathway protein D